MVQVFSVFIFIFALSLPVYASTPIYRYQTADGKIIYSDQAPTSAPAQYQPEHGKQVPIPISPAPTAEEIKRMSAERRAAYEQVTARMAAREREFEQAWQTAQAAKLKAEQLAQARERQREALPGERVRSVYGNNRLTSRYHERQAQLDQQLQAAQQQAQQQQQQLMRFR
jgi:multidrug efflux pump subunit AcrA (membrane-fusion protein)